MPIKGACYVCTFSRQLVFFHADVSWYTNRDHSARRRSFGFISMKLHVAPTITIMKKTVLLEKGRRRTRGSKFYKPQTLTLKSSRWRPLTVCSAISRTKKEETVEAVKQNHENCHLIAGIRYKGLTVKQLQELRRSLPDSARLLVAKNTLVGKAIEGTAWEALKPCTKGMNAWMFVHGEEIPEALKPYRAFQKERKLEENDFTGRMSSRCLRQCRARAEIYTKLLGAVQGPAVSLVSAVRAPARDVVMVLKAYVKKLEDGGRA